jgi:hypothetical protein
MIRSPFKKHFQKEVPTDEPLPVHVDPAASCGLVDDTPDKQETTYSLLAVKRMRCIKSPGPAIGYLCL